jgi:hypothetical protein
MDKGPVWLAWVPTVVGAAVLLLVVLNIVLFNNNVDLQRQANARQQQINGAIRLGAINNQLIQMLATASVRDNDADIRAMLARHGITYSVTPAQPPAAAAPAPAGGAQPR